MGFRLVLWGLVLVLLNFLSPAHAILPGVYPLSPHKEALRAFKHSLGGGDINYAALKQEQSINSDPAQLLEQLFTNPAYVESKRFIATYLLDSPFSNEKLKEDALSFLNELRRIDETTFQNTIVRIPNAYTTPIVEEYLFNKIYYLIPPQCFYSAETKNMLLAHYVDPDISESDKELISIHLHLCNLVLPTQTSSIPTDPIELYQFMMKMIDQLPGDIKDKSKLVQAVLFLQKMIFKDTDTTYPRLPTSANKGMVNYYSEMNTDTKTALTSALVYAELRRQPIFSYPNMWETTDVNAWDLALKATHGDRLGALRALSTFGHDDCCNALVTRYYQDPHQYPKEVALLNTLWRPSGIPNRQTILDIPGNLDGLNITSSLLREYSVLRKKMLDLELNIIGHFFPAYYHFYGGVAVATELIAHGFDRAGPIRIPIFFSELLGYFYKMLANQQYLSADPDVWMLYKAGYVKYRQPKRPPIPYGWSKIKYESAILSLDEGLLAVELNVDQHRKGAEWAYQVLSK